uniref:Uncharacterized protein n=1 Tax=Avena sativa TaxID=4498 RepID=A0ACD5X335_AVESA
MMQSLPPKFAARLDIPPGFAIATLRDPAGRSWHVDLDPRRPCFTGTGWRSFLAATGVSAGHLLVFEHLGGLLFNVEPFDASGCSLDVLAHDRQHVVARTACSRSVPDDDHDADVQSDYNINNNSSPMAPSAPVAKKRKRSPCGRRSTPECGDDDEHLLRCTIERPSHLHYLYLTKALCNRMGWTASRTAQLSVVAGRGERRWLVAVKVSDKGGMMVTGWADFAKDNASGSRTPASSGHPF